MIMSNSCVMVPSRKSPNKDLRDKILGMSDRELRHFYPKEEHPMSWSRKTILVMRLTKVISIKDLKKIRRMASEGC